MFETALTLTCAHFLADFLFQTQTMIAHKKRFDVLVLHVAIVTGLSAMLLGALHWQLLAFIAISHFVTDYIKTNYCLDDAPAFLADQGFHLLVIAMVAGLYPAAYAEGVWPSMLGVSQRSYLAGLALVTGIILITKAGGVMIGKLIAPLADEIDPKAPEGLSGGGRYIGWLERAIVLLLVMTSNPAGIGFLITAKSILRFGEVKDSKDRKLAEYIIIGTFMSFGWALLVAYLMVFVIGLSGSGEN